MASPKSVSDSNPKLSLEQVNAMDCPDFISHFGSVIEHGTLAAASVYASRPFRDITALHQAFNLFIQSLSGQARAGLIRCYPDLAGRLAEENRLNRESLEEHRAAGLLELTEEEREELRSLNSSYKDKFDFPFVVCARENRKEAIMREIRARLGNGLLDEVENALAEISKIAYHRISGIVSKGDTLIGDCKL